VDLLVETSLERGPLGLEVPHLVTEPVQPLEHLGLLDHRLAVGLQVGGARSGPQDPQGDAEAQTGHEHREGGEQLERAGGVHGPRVAASADSRPATGGR